MIVIGAVVLLVIAGAALLMLSSQRAPADPVTPQPSATVPPTTQPTATSEPTATTEPTEEPSPEPTETATSEPPAGVIDLGSGVMFVPAPGWEIQEQAPGAISVSDGKAVLVTRVVQQKKGINAGQLCDAFNRQVLKEAPGARFGDPKDIPVKLKNMAVASCPAAFVSTENGKSTQMLVVTFAGVRTSDGLATLSTMLYTQSTPDSSFDDINKMLNIVLGTQSAG